MTADKPKEGDVRGAMDILFRGWTRWTSKRARRLAARSSPPGLVVSAHYPPDYFRVGIVDPLQEQVVLALDGTIITEFDEYDVGVVFLRLPPGRYTVHVASQRHPQAVFQSVSVSVPTAGDGCVAGMRFVPSVRWMGLFSGHPGRLVVCEPLAVS